MTASVAEIEAQVLAYVHTNGAAYFSELRLEIASPSKPLERALSSLLESHQLVAHIEPGTYPNRIRYELPGREASLRALPRERYWEGEFGPPTRDAELNMEADLRMAAYHRQAWAMRCLTAEPRLISAVLLEGADQAALDDLGNVGLVLTGVDLGAREQTCRLSALGRVVQGRLR